jgi:hypothetical protein
MRAHHQAAKEDQPVLGEVDGGVGGGEVVDEGENKHHLQQRGRRDQAQ